MLWKIATGAASIVIAPGGGGRHARLSGATTMPASRRSLRRGEEIDMEMLIDAPGERGLHARWTSSRCRASSPAAAASSTSTRRRRTGRCASSSSATRSNPSASSIRRRSARQRHLDEAWLLPLTETPVIGGSAGRRARAAERKPSLMPGDDPELLDRGARRRRRQRLSRVGVFLPAWPAPTGTLLRSASEGAGLCRRAGHGAQPAGPLVEQGRAAARAQRHRHADHGRKTSTFRRTNCWPRICIATRPGHGPTRRGGCAG